VKTSGKKEKQKVEKEMQDIQSAPFFTVKSL
jgi:hypothetical protein